MARTGGAFDFEGVAIVEIKLQQPTQDQHIDRQPDRPAPIGVSAEHSRVGLGGEVPDFVAFAVNIEYVRMLFVPPGERPDAKGREKPFLIKHTRKNST